MVIDILSEKGSAEKRLDAIMSQIARTVGTRPLIGLVREFRSDLAGADPLKIVAQWEQILRVVKVLDDVLVFLIAEDQDIFILGEDADLEKKEG